ncbi:MAG: thioredoxin [Archaeoglobi archaeon]|jgi:thioredoxin 1|nr:MAG: thioredoxin [Archaeoglobi archaeon]
MDEIEEIRKKKLRELMEMAEGKDSITAGPVKLDSKNFDEFIKKNTNAVVDFWAEWCRPCRYIAPVVEELAKEYSGKVAFGKLNIDESRNFVARFGISAIPTLIFFKNGIAVDQIVGALPKKEIKRWIDLNLQRSD